MQLNAHGRVFLCFVLLFLIRDLAVVVRIISPLGTVNMSEDAVEINVFFILMIFYSKNSPKSDLSLMQNN